MNKRDFLKYITGLCASTGIIALFHNNNKAYGRLCKSDIINDYLENSEWKWKKEALFYEVANNVVYCKLCPNLCVLKNGGRGLCKARVNHSGMLYSHSYGNPCSLYNDPVEKKPLFHFLPGSRTLSFAVAGCNLHCLNCQNWAISQIKPEDAYNYDLTPSQIVDKAITAGSKSISYTYSEPTTFYEYVADTSKLSHTKGLKNIYVSNGYINEKPLRYLAKHLDAANIDLKSFSNEIYNKLNSGTLQPVLDTLKILKEENVWIEITNLVIPQWTDDMKMISSMCEWLVQNNFQNYPLHFSRFFPVYKLTNIPSTPLATLEKARNIAIGKGMKYVYIGNVPNTNYENTICPECKKILVERKGFSILTNNIVNGRCRFCNEKIPGIWM